MVHSESFAKILGSLDIYKAMGADSVHPSLLGYISEGGSRFLYGCYCVAAKCLRI